MTPEEYQRQMQLAQQQEAAARVFLPSTIEQISGSAAAGVQSAQGRQGLLTKSREAALQRKHADRKQARVLKAAKEQQARALKAAKGAASAEQTSMPTLTKEGEFFHLKDGARAAGGYGQGRLYINGKHADPEEWASSSDVQAAQERYAKIVKDSPKEYQLRESLDTITDILRPYYAAAKAEDRELKASDIPGMGRFTGRTGVIGKVGRFAQGEAADRNYQAMRRYVNMVVRLRAGLSQTASEVERVVQETGDYILADPDAMFDRLNDEIKTANKWLKIKRNQLSAKDRDILQKLNPDSSPGVLFEQIPTLDEMMEVEVLGRRAVD